MAFAPYWLSPTLWPFPLPVMVKVPAFGTAAVLVPPFTVEVPAEEITDTELPCKVLVPPEEITEIPSNEGKQVPEPFT